MATPMGDGNVADGVAVTVGRRFRCRPLVGVVVLGVGLVSTLWRSSQEIRFTPDMPSCDPRDLVFRGVVVEDEATADFSVDGYIFSNALIDITDSDDAAYMGKRIAVFSTPPLGRSARVTVEIVAGAWCVQSPDHSWFAAIIDGWDREHLTLWRSISCDAAHVCTTGQPLLGFR